MFRNWEEGESLWKRNGEGRGEKKSKFRNIVYLEVPYMGVGLSISEHTAAVFCRGFSLNTVTLWC